MKGFRFVFVAAWWMASLATAAPPADLDCGLTEIVGNENTSSRRIPMKWEPWKLSIRGLDSQTPKIRLPELRSLADYVPATKAVDGESDIFLTRPVSLHGVGLLTIQLTLQRLVVAPTRQVSELRPIEVQLTRHYAKAQKTPNVDFTYAGTCKVVDP